MVPMPRNKQIVKRGLSHLKIGKQKVTPPSWIKNLGMG